MYRQRVILPALACALLLLEGCASVAPPPTVALIGSPDPARLRVTIEKLPDNGGSFERSMMFSTEMFNREFALAQMLQPPGFAPAVLLTDALADALQKPGRVVVRAANPQRDREEFLKDYGALGAKGAIYVDILPRAIGYWTDLAEGPYRPWVLVGYRVYDSREGKVLTTGLIGMGPEPRGETVSDVVAQDNQFTFATFDTVTDEPIRAAAGLRAAIVKVSQALAQKIQY
jgi:hypothetical protein